MVRRRSLRRRSIKKSLRSRRRDRACNSYDLRSRRLRTLFGRKRSLRASYRFGAEEKQNLASALAQIIVTHPLAAKAVAEIAATAILQRCGIEEDGAIDKNCPDTQELHKFLEEWGKNGRLPPMKPTKFGVDPLNMLAVQKAAKKILDALRKEADKAEAAYKEAEAAYYEKLRKMEPKVVYIPTVTGNKK